MFGYDYGEIAGILGKNEDNCRQLAVRARRQVEARKPRFEASRRRREELARRFFAAAEQGDTEGLISMLAADAVAYGDGGGRALAFPHPVHGREHVVRLLLGLRNRMLSLRLTWRPAEINGQPGALFLDPEGDLVFVVSLDIVDSVEAVRAISNPEKLHHLGRVSDALARPRGPDAPERSLRRCVPCRQGDTTRGACSSAGASARARATSSSTWPTSP